MCLHGSVDNHNKKVSSMSCPSKLVPRKSRPRWQVMFWSPLEWLLVLTTTIVCLGLVTAVAAAVGPLLLNISALGTLAALVQGILSLLHGFCEGPRLQILPLYVAALVLALNATGVFGRSAAMLLAVGIVMLLLECLSLFMCYELPRLLPVGGRGPYAVAIATDHIRTPVDDKDTKTTALEEERWPLELMVQVFYPVENSTVDKLPWFPSTLGRFHRSLAPAWGGIRRLPFGMTQVGLVGAGIIICSVTSITANTVSLWEEDLSSWSSFLTSAHVWSWIAASALCLTCLVSDVRIGSSRSAYKARYLAREQAKRIAEFAKKPGWMTEYVCGFRASGFDAGHFHGPDLPCFPPALLGPGERKRPLVIFSHGLGGNRAIYSEHASEIASHGYVAVFLEHNDASASSCMFPDGRVTSYIPGPNAEKVFAEENRGYRLAQLKRRGREVALTRAHLAKLARGVSTDFEACHRVGLGSIIDIKRPAFVGHSFGGATVLQGLHDELASKGDSQESEFSMAFVMDPWTFPMCDHAREQGITIPVIFITTDTFLGPAGTAIEDRLVENAVARVRGGGNHLAIQLRVKDAEHNNFSDSALFAPGIMRKLKSAGEMDGVTFIDQVTRLTLCSLEVFLRGRNESGDLPERCASRELSSVLLGSDLAEAFPEARVRRASARGVLPPMDVQE